MSPDTLDSDTPDSDPQQRLEADLRSAMKARDRLRVDTLRMLLTTVKNRRIETGEALAEQDFVALVRRGLKQRQESAALYRKGDRAELAEKEEAEIELLSEYLPPQVDEAALRQAVEDYIGREGVSGIQAMGQVMKAMMERFGSSADGKTLAAIVREFLS